MKIRKYNFTSILIGITFSISACTASNPIKDVRTHNPIKDVREQKGQGTHRVFIGKEEDLMQNVERKCRKASKYVSCTRELHAIFIQYSEMDKAVALYFSPSSQAGKTDVELVDSWPSMEKVLGKEGLRSKVLVEANLVGVLLTDLVNTRIADKNFDPNVPVGNQLLLAHAAMQDDEVSAIKLIKRGADVGMAIKEMQANVKGCADKVRSNSFGSANEESFCKGFISQTDSGLTLLKKLKKS